MDGSERSIPTKRLLIQVREHGVKNPLTRAVVVEDEDVNIAAGRVQHLYSQLAKTTNARALYSTRELHKSK